MYTSGSTGTPKGVRDRAPLDRPAGRAARLRRARRQRRDSCTPRRSASTRRRSRSGARCSTAARCVVYAIRCRPAAAWRGRSPRHGVTTAWLTAALFNAVVDDDPRLLSGVTQLLTGGEALSAAHVRRALAALPATELINGYGPTECTTFTATYRIPRDCPGRRRRSRSAGRSPTRSATCSIATAQPVPVGDRRRAVHRRPRAWRAATWRGPSSTPSASSPIRSAPGERLYRTGDLRPLAARRRDRIRRPRRRPGQDPRLPHRARRDRGRASARSRACRRARWWSAARARSASGWSPTSCRGRGARRRAGTARAAGRRCCPSSWCRRRSSGSTRCRSPPTASSTARALPAPTSARPELAQPYRAPRGEREAAICAAFAGVLGLDQVGAHDNFFELGGNSLLALRAAGAAARRRTARACRQPSSSRRRRRRRWRRAIDARRGRATHAPRARAGRARDEPIAIIGMAGRFPGARRRRAFWENLCDGRESITLLPADELDPSIPAAQRARPGLRAGARRDRRRRAVRRRRSSASRRAKRS